MSNLLNYLEDQGSWTALVSSRTWPGEDDPPDSYDVSDGPGASFKGRGGGRNYNGVLLAPSIQFRVFADDMRQAYDTARTLYDVLDERGSGYDVTLAASWGIVGALEEVPIQTFRDAETEWPSALSFYRVRFKDCG